MIIYEVNLEVEPEIQNEFTKWLDQHIKEILSIEGFTKAQWFNRDPKDEDLNPKLTYFTIHYYLKDREAYENYLQNHASFYRKDGQKRFGKKFKANRRVLELTANFLTKNV